MSLCGSHSAKTSSGPVKQRSRGAPGAREGWTLDTGMMARQPAGERAGGQRGPGVTQRTRPEARTHTTPHRHAVISCPPGTGRATM